MLNFAKVCCAVAFCLASGGAVSAGLSANCVATDGNNMSLLVKIDKKKKKHKNGQSHNDVDDEHAQQAPAQTDQKANNNVLWGDYFQTKPGQAGQGADDTFHGKYENGTPQP